MEFVGKVMLFLIFLIFIFTLLNMYIHYYKQAEYFSSDCNSLYKLSDSINGISEKIYTIINNSKEYLNLNSTNSLILCKCPGDNTEWSVQYKNDDDYSISDYKLSVSKEDFCFLEGVFKECSYNIYTSKNKKINQYLCCRKNRY